MPQSDPSIPANREHPVPCRGLHPMKYRPTTFADDGFCGARCRDAARRDLDAARAERLSRLEAEDRALELAESFR